MYAAAQLDAAAIVATVCGALAIEGRTRARRDRA
jgi:hypothetical protein